MSMGKQLLRERLRNLANKTARRITEETLNSKTIINVDIQPEYADAISFNTLKKITY